MDAAELRAKFKECATNDPRNRTTPLERILPMLDALVTHAEEQEAELVLLASRIAAMPNP
jgi:hypothetical protein